MRNHTLFAALAVAALVPSLAAAQNACEQRKHNNRVAGTIIGGVAGAILGSQVSGHGARTEGSVIGGVGGAVVGNQLARSKEDCSGYGYYDSSGAWHANVSGYYDNSRGRWVDARSDNGYYDADGVWHARTRGYMDSDGYWVSQAPSAGSYGADVAYTGRDRWNGAPTSIRQRESWLEQQIQVGRSDGSLTRDEADRARDQLFDIRRKEAAYRRDDGVLSPRDRSAIQYRLDNLAQNIRDWRSNGDHRY
jgi:uncharacterized protein YcfJ